jgi:hypothetical protein
MNVEQAWQNVLGLLQSEMPRASFDTWVRDTQVVSYELGVLVVGARNAYARDWLENRLTETISRLLAGMLDQSATVRFVVLDAPEDEPDEELSDADETESEIAIEPVQYVDYEALVQPHKQVVVKGYLRRLCVEIGPKAIWLYIGFHQAAWMAGQKQSVFLMRSREVRRFSGISDGAFWRLMRNLDIRAALHGLVERVDPAPMRLYQRGRDGRPHRAPVRYRVYLTPRLTRADAQALYLHLQAEVEQGKSLAVALQAVLELPNLLEDLLPPLTETASDAPHFSNLHTVMEVARVIVEKTPSPGSPSGDLPYGHDIAGQALDESVLKLAQEVHRRVVNCLGDIHIRHYFIEEVIPGLNLSPAQAWLITVARDMAYINWRTGERREKVIFHGGYAEMAALVGANRYKTIQEWLNPFWKAHRKGGDLSRFFSELELEDDSRAADPSTGSGQVLRIAGMPRCYRVLLDEPVLDANGGNKLDANGGIRVDADGGNSWTPMAGLVDANGGIMVDANGGVKSTLNTASNTHEKTTSTTQHAQNAAAVAAVAAVPHFWELGKLLQQNDVHPKVQRELLEMEASVHAFVSWVLFAVSAQSGNLSDPLGYALSRIREHPLREARGIFRQLADIPPAELLGLFKSTPTRRYEIPIPNNHPLAPAWKQAMGSQNRRLPAARVILFGEGGSEN